MVYLAPWLHLIDGYPNMLPNYPERRRSAVFCCGDATYYCVVYYGRVFGFMFVFSMEVCRSFDGQFSFSNTHSFFPSLDIT